MVSTLQGCATKPSSTSSNERLELWEPQWPHFVRVANPPTSTIALASDQSLPSSCDTSFRTPTSSSAPIFPGVLPSFSASPIINLCASALTCSIVGAFRHGMVKASMNALICFELSDVANQWSCFETSTTAYWPIWRATMVHDSSLSESRRHRYYCCFGVRLACSSASSIATPSSLELNYDVIGRESGCDCPLVIHRRPTTRNLAAYFIEVV